MRRVGAALAVLCLVACGRPDRPIRGAEPGSTDTQPGVPPTLAVGDSRLQTPPSPSAPTKPAPAALGVPASPAATQSPTATGQSTPTSASQPSPTGPSQSTPTSASQPSPAATAAAGASPTGPSQPPIVRTIAPTAGAQVDAGAPVTVSAVLVGRGADLADASLTIDGAPAGSIDKQAARQWAISGSQALAPGPHTARVLVTDANGVRGGYTWQFTVGGGAAPAPAPPKPAAPPSTTPR